MMRPKLPSRLLPRIVWTVCLPLALGPLLPATGVADQIESPPGPVSQPTPASRRSLAPDPSLTAEPLGPGSTLRLEHMREEERRKRLLSDTSKLVQLTGELKAEVEKASKDELSIDVVRKAAEIEKLARDVKERMKS